MTLGPRVVGHGGRAERSATVMAGACVVRRNSRWVVVVRLIYGNDLELALDYTLRCSGVLATADKGEWVSPPPSHTQALHASPSRHHLTLNTKLRLDATLPSGSLLLRWHNLDAFASPRLTRPTST